MKVFRAILVVFHFFLFFGWTAMTYSAIDTTSRSEVHIVRAEFGLFNSPESEKPLFVATKTVPLTENQSYGWMILLVTKKTTIRWREELTLPSAPATWGDGEIQGEGVHSISADRKVSVLECEVQPEDGLISNAWVLTPGDPKGHYVIRVTIENSLERTFEFDVE